MSVLHGYNGEIFSTALLVVKITNLSKFFWMGEILRGPVLLVYNERSFSQPRYHSKEPYMMGSLFGKILPSVATRNPT